MIASQPGKTGRDGWIRDASAIPAANRIFMCVVSVLLVNIHKMLPACRFHKDLVLRIFEYGCQA
ncbi:MAG TPA: hypothetical protein DCG24_03815 [Bacteroidetes bacterium]|nr:hypothetical protein [Bacteroidota bacterium]HAE35889.1 hypothetical protein [Bacteroidota bacterium]